MSFNNQNDKNRQQPGMGQSSGGQQKPQTPNANLNKDRDSFNKKPGSTTGSSSDRK